MVAPSEKPRWATAGGAQITHPSSGFQDLGYEPNTPAGAGVRNWLDNLIYQWIDWFDTRDSANNSAHATFTGDISDLEKGMAAHQELRALLNGRAMIDVDGSTANQVFGACVLPGFAADASDTGIVVVGSGGEIHTSTDNGASWTARTSGVATTLLDVIRGVAGSDRLIAIGQLGKILTGDETGITWTARTSGTTESLNCIARASSSGPYMIAGSSGTILVSSNGTTWTAATAIHGGVFEAKSIEYMSGRWIVCGFVAPVDPDVCVFISDDDGTTWTAVKNSGSSALWGATGLSGDITAIQIAQVGGVLIALIADNSAGSKFVIRSLDQGSSWTTCAGVPSTLELGTEMLVAGAQMIAVVSVDNHRTGIASLDGGANWFRMFFPGMGSVGRVKRLPYNSDAGHGTCQFIGLGRLSSTGGADDRGKVSFTDFFSA